MRLLPIIESWIIWNRIVTLGFIKYISRLYGLALALIIVIIQITFKTDEKLVLLDYTICKRPEQNARLPWWFLRKMKYQETLCIREFLNNFFQYLAGQLMFYIEMGLGEFVRPSTTLTSFDSLNNIVIILEYNFVRCKYGKYMLFIMRFFIQIDTNNWKIKMWILWVLTGIVKYNIRL